MFFLFLRYNWAMAELKRNISKHFLRWKSKNERRPLIVWGARQVGKSTSIAQFGNAQFRSLHTFNFQKEPSLKAIFHEDLNPSHLVQSLSLIRRREITEQDLIFFDEIQECPEALTSLKYFAENLPSQPLIAAGSHLGLVKNEAAFPVGKVEFLSLHPLTFFEFLENFEPETADFLKAQELLLPDPVSEFYHQRALHWLRIYLCTGGMPEVLNSFKSNSEGDDERKSAMAAREIQLRLVESYQSDFSKHAGTVNANHILRVFDNVALQLGRAQDETVKKLKFSNVIPKKKGFEAIEGPLTWLEKSRLIIKASIANRFEQPIRAFTAQNYFKAYLFDVGILNAMLNVPVESLLLEQLGQFKGYLAENFVAQELYSVFDKPLISWSERESEVEFIISRGSQLCPIEVKASKRSRQAKSLDALIARYHPETSFKLTGQNRGYLKERKIYTLPLYWVSKICEPNSTNLSSVE